LENDKIHVFSLKKQRTDQNKSFVEACLIVLACGNHVPWSFETNVFVKYCSLFK